MNDEKGGPAQPPPYSPYGGDASVPSPYGQQPAGFNSDAVPIHQQVYCESVMNIPILSFLCPWKRPAHGPADDNASYWAMEKIV